MTQPKITAWMKPSCGWSMGVRAVLSKYNLVYEDKDVINSFENREEMIRVSGQSLQPTLRIGEQVLADISGEELEQWLVQHKVGSSSDVEINVPLDQPCAHEMVPPSATVKINF
jgi:glutaredoxin